MPLKKEVETAPYDFADYVDSVEDVQALLAHAFEDGDPAIITRAIGIAARSKGMVTIAEQTGLKSESIHKTLSENGNFEFETLVTVLDALGMRLRIEVVPGSRLAASTSIDTSPAAPSAASERRAAKPR